MEKEKRLIDANELFKQIHTFSVVVTGLRSGKGVLNEFAKHYRESVLRIIEEAPTVEAVEVSDKELLKAIGLLIKQYEHSKNSEYVYSPVAHALYHTWKQVDEGLKNDK